MATVLEFPATRAPVARPSGAPVEAEIVFFPGVRIERHDTPADAVMTRDDIRRN